MQNEIWKPVPSKPGMTASSWGRVCLPSSTMKMPHGGMRSYEPKPTYGCITKASKTARYKYMSLSNKKFGNMKIHRLVCEAFYGVAPFDKAIVIHIDENACNNKAENLRWGTQKENLNMPKFIEYCKSRTGENNPATKGKKAKILRKKLCI